jgi:hypothetical protein
MLSDVERKFLEDNPYFLINNSFYKFKEVVYVEGDVQLIIVRNLDNGQIKKLSLYDFKKSTEELQVTAQGKCYELMIEIKRMIELLSLK